MKKRSINSSILFISIFIVILSIITSTQYMISPNLLIISEYFGFGGDTTQIGVLTFMFTILSGISVVLSGYLADKVNRKWLLFFGAIICSVFSTLTFLVTAGIEGFFLFFFITSMIGIGLGAIVPSIFSLIGDLVKQDQRSKGFSFYSIASLLGTVFGLGIATFIGSIDWRMPYFIVGIVGFFSTILIIFFKEPSRIGKDFSALLEKEAIEYTYRINISDLKVIFKKKTNIWLIVNFVDTIPTGIITFLIFAYMEDYHNISSDLTLVILLLIMFSILLGTIIFGFVGDYLFKKGNKKARILLALFGNVAPIPFVFIALIIPFEAPANTSIGELFLIPGALVMIILFVIGIFLNGPVSGSWFASVVDLNLPEHRGTVLATANFFDLVGRSLGPLIGAIMADLFGFVYGMMVSIFAWILLPFFWIPVLKNVLTEMEDIEKVFAERLETLKSQKKSE